MTGITTWKFRRNVAAFAALLFTADTLLGSAPPVAAAPFPDPLQVKIPPELGSVEEFYSPPAPLVPSGKVPFVIHIQDAHAHPEAQRNIQAILEYLSREKKIRKIAVEGAFGKIDPQAFNFFPIPEVNVAMAEHLAQMGELTGAELFALRSRGRAAQVHGVDDIELYRESFHLFQKIKSQKEKIRVRSDFYRRLLGRVEADRLNEDLGKLVQKRKDWEENQDESLAYFRTLQELSAKHLGLDFTDPKHQFEWPHLTRLLTVDERESRLKRETARSEFERLLRELEKRLPAGARREFLIEGLKRLLPDSGAAPFDSWLAADRRFPDIRTLRNFFESLYRETKKGGIPLLNYPNFLALGGILILREEIDASPLLKETKAVEARLETKLVRNPEEEKILRLGKDFSLLARLLELGMTREEFEAYQQRKRGIRFPLLPKKLIDLAEEFYLLSRKRDQVLLENTLKLSQGPRATVLITGGFHSAGLGELLREKQIPYLVITPKMTRLESENLYEKVMRGGNSDLGEWLASAYSLVKALAMNFIQNPEIYQDAGMDPEPMRKILIKAALMAARSDLKSLREMVRRKPELFGNVDFVAGKNGEIKVRLGTEVRRRVSTAVSRLPDSRIPMILSSAPFWFSTSRIIRSNVWMDLAMVFTMNLSFFSTGFNISMTSVTVNMSAFLANLPLFISQLLLKRSAGNGGLILSRTAASVNSSRAEVRAQNKGGSRAEGEIRKRIGRGDAETDSLRISKRERLGEQAPTESKWDPLLHSSFSALSRNQQPIKVAKYIIHPETNKDKRKPPSLTNDPMINPARNTVPAFVRNFFSDSRRPSVSSNIEYRVARPSSSVKAKINIYNKLKSYLFLHPPRRAEVRIKLLKDFVAVPPENYHSAQQFGGVSRFQQVTHGLSDVPGNGGMNLDKNDSRGRGGEEIKEIPVPRNQDRLLVAGHREDLAVLSARRDAGDLLARRTEKPFRLTRHIFVEKESQLFGKSDEVAVLQLLGRKMEGRPNVLPRELGVIVSGGDLLDRNAGFKELQHQVDHNPRRLSLDSETGPPVADGRNDRYIFVDQGVHNKPKVSIGPDPGQAHLLAPRAEVRTSRAVISTPFPKHLQPLQKVVDGLLSQIADYTGDHLFNSRVFKIVTSARQAEKVYAEEIRLVSEGIQNNPEAVNEMLFGNLIRVIWFRQEGEDQPGWKGEAISTAHPRNSSDREALIEYVTKARFVSVDGEVTIPASPRAEVRNPIIPLEVPKDLSRDERKLGRFVEERISVQGEGITQATEFERVQVAFVRGDGAEVTDEFKPGGNLGIELPAGSRLRVEYRKGVTASLKEGGEKVRRGVPAGAEEAVKPVVQAPPLSAFVSEPVRASKTLLFSREKEERLRKAITEFLLPPIVRSFLKDAPLFSSTEELLRRAFKDFAVKVEIPIQKTPEGKKYFLKLSPSIPGGYVLDEESGELLRLLVRTLIEGRTDAEIEAVNQGEGFSPLIYDLYLKLSRAEVRVSREEVLNLYHDFESLRFENENVRSVRDLKKLGSEAVAILAGELPRLEDPLWMVVLLGFLKEAQALSALIRLVRETEVQNSYLREKTLEAINKILEANVQTIQQNADLKNHLIQDFTALARTEDISTKAHAVQGLLLLGVEETHKDLIDSFAHQIEEELRARSQSLPVFRTMLVAVSPRHLSILMDIVRRTEEPNDELQAVARILKNWNEKLTEGMKEKTAEELFRYAQNRDLHPWTVQLALRAISEIGTDQALNMLIHFTSSRELAQIREEAVSGLKKNESRAARLIIQKIQTATPDDLVRWGNLFDQTTALSSPPLYELFKEEGRPIADRLISLFHGNLPRMVEVVTSSVFPQSQAAQAIRAALARMDRLEAFAEKWGEKFLALVYQWGFHTVSYWVLLEDEALPQLLELLSEMTEKPSTWDWQSPDRTLGSIAQMAARILQQENGPLVNVLISSILSRRQSLDNEILALLPEIEKNPPLAAPWIAFLTVLLELKMVKFHDGAQAAISQFLNSPIDFDYYLASRLIRSMDYPRTIETSDRVRNTAIEFDTETTAVRIVKYIRKKLHTPDKDSTDRYFVGALFTAMRLRSPEPLRPYLKAEFADEVLQDLTPEVLSHWDQIFQIILKTLNEEKGFTETPNEIKDPALIPIDWLEKFMPKLQLGEAPDRKLVADAIRLYQDLIAHYDVSLAEVERRGLRAAGEEVEALVRSGRFLEAMQAVNVRRRQYKSKSLEQVERLDIEIYEFSRKHKAQAEWGFWNYDPRFQYSESKFNAFNDGLYLEAYQNQLLKAVLKQKVPALLKRLKTGEAASRNELAGYLLVLIDHLVISGLGSRDLEAIGQVLRNERLPIDQIRDLLILLLEEHKRMLDYFNDTYGSLAGRTAVWIGREDLAPNYRNIPVGSDLTNDEYYQLVEETLTGNFVAEEEAVGMLEQFVRLLSQELKGVRTRWASVLSPSHKGLTPEVVRFGEDGPLREDITMAALGKKGKNLVELDSLGLPVPPGAILTTAFPIRETKRLEKAVVEEILRLEKLTGKHFPFSEAPLKKYEALIKQHRQAPTNPLPLLVSVRSSSMISMPGIYDTVSNVPMNDTLTIAMIKNGAEPWFVYDVYRRFLSSYGEAIYGIPKIEFIRIIDQMKSETNKEEMYQFNEKEMKILVERFKEKIRETAPTFEDNPDPLGLLVRAVEAVSDSWDHPLAQTFRAQSGYFGKWGNAVILQVMVFGNFNGESSTAVVETERGSIKVNHKARAQGADLVGGATKHYLHQLSEIPFAWAKKYRQLANRLVQYYHSDQQIEITTENGQFHVLQTRNVVQSIPGKELVISEQIQPLARGEGVAGGAEAGRLIFADEMSLDELKAQIRLLRYRMDRQNEKGLGIILVLDYITPEETLKLIQEDVTGVITPVAGSSHGALNARKLGKSLVAGLELGKDKEGNRILAGHPLRGGLGGDTLTIDGRTGRIYRGSHPLRFPEQRYVGKEEVSEERLAEEATASPPAPPPVKEEPMRVKSPLFQYDSERKPVLTESPIRLAVNVGHYRFDKGRLTTVLESNFDPSAQVATNTVHNRVFDAYLREIVGDPNISLTDIYGVKDVNRLYALLIANPFHGRHPADQMELKKERESNVLVINGHAIRIHETVPAPERMKQYQTEYLIDFSDPDLTDQPKEVREKILKDLQQASGLKRVFSFSGDEDPAEEAAAAGINAEQLLDRRSYLPLASPLTLALGHVWAVIDSQFKDQFEMPAGIEAVRPLTGEGGGIRLILEKKFIEALRSLFPNLTIKYQGNSAGVVEYDAPKGAGNVRILLIPKQGSAFAAVGKLEKDAQKKQMARLRDQIHLAFQEVAHTTHVDYIRYAEENENLDSLHGILQTKPVVFDSQATTVLETGEVEIVVHYNDIGYAASLNQMIRQAILRDRESMTEAQTQAFLSDLEQGKWRTGTISPNRRRAVPKEVEAGKEIGFIIVGIRGRIGKLIYKILASDPNYVPRAFIGVENIDTLLQQYKYDLAHGPMDIMRDDETYELEKATGLMEGYLLLKNKKTGEYLQESTQEIPLAIPYFHLKQRPGEPEEAFERRVREELDEILLQTETLINAGGFALEKNDPYYKAFTEDDEGNKNPYLKRIILTTPPKGEVDLTVIRGVNEDQIFDVLQDQPEGEPVYISCASCTTAGLTRLLIEITMFLSPFGIKYIRFVTDHGITPRQGGLFGAPSAGKSLRTANDPKMISTLEETGANQAVILVRPEFKGILSGIARRDANYSGSLLKVSIWIPKSDQELPTAQELNEHIHRLAPREEFQRVISYRPEVQSTAQIVGDKTAGIFLPHLTRLEEGQENAVYNIGIGYDNEAGYAEAVAHIEKVSALAARGLITPESAMVSSVQKESPVNKAYQGNYQVLLERLSQYSGYTQDKIKLSAEDFGVFQSTISGLLAAAKQYSNPERAKQLLDEIQKTLQVIRPLGNEENIEIRNIEAELENNHAELETTLNEPSKGVLRSEMRSQEKEENRELIAEGVRAFLPPGMGDSALLTARMLSSRAEVRRSIQTSLRGNIPSDAEAISHPGSLRRPEGLLAMTGSRRAEVRALAEQWNRERDQVPADLLSARTGKELAGRFRIYLAQSQSAPLLAREKLDSFGTRDAFVISSVSSEKWREGLLAAVALEQEILKEDISQMTGEALLRWLGHQGVPTPRVPTASNKGGPARAEMRARGEEIEESLQDLSEIVNDADLPHFQRERAAQLERDLRVASGRVQKVPGIEKPKDLEQVIAAVRYFLARAEVRRGISGRVSFGRRNVQSSKWLVRLPLRPQLHKRRTESSQGFPFLFLFGMKNQPEIIIAAVKMATNILGRNPRRKKKSVVTIPEKMSVDTLRHALPSSILRSWFVEGFVGIGLTIVADNVLGIYIFGNNYFPPRAEVRMKEGIKTLLIIEDSLIEMGILTKEIQEAFPGINLLTAEDAGEAHKVLEEKGSDIDAILSDFHLVSIRQFQKMNPPQQKANSAEAVIDAVQTLGLNTPVIVHSNAPDIREIKNRLQGRTIAVIPKAIDFGTSIEELKKLDASLRAEVRSVGRGKHPVPSTTKDEGEPNQKETLHWKLTRGAREWIPLAPLFMDASRELARYYDAGPASRRIQRHWLARKIKSRFPIDLYIRLDHDEGAPRFFKRSLRRFDAGLTGFSTERYMSSLGLPTVMGVLFYWAQEIPRTFLGANRTPWFLARSSGMIDWNWISLVRETNLGFLLRTPFLLVSNLLFTLFEGLAALVYLPLSYLKRWKAGKEEEVRRSESVSLKFPRRRAEVRREPVVYQGQPLKDIPLHNFDQLRKVFQFVQEKGKQLDEGSRKWPPRWGVAVYAPKGEEMEVFSLEKFLAQEKTVEQIQGDLLSLARDYFGSVGLSELHSWDVVITVFQHEEPKKTFLEIHFQLSPSMWVGLQAKEQKRIDPSTPLLPGVSLTFHTLSDSKTRLDWTRLDSQQSLLTVTSEEGSTWEIVMSQDEAFSIEGSRKVPGTHRIQKLGSGLVERKTKPDLYEALRRIFLKVATASRAEVRNIEEALETLLHLVEEQVEARIALIQLQDRLEHSEPAEIDLYERLYQYVIDKRGDFLSPLQVKYAAEPKKIQRYEEAFDRLEAFLSNPLSSWEAMEEEPPPLVKDLSPSLRRKLIIEELGQLVLENKDEGSVQITREIMEGRLRHKEISSLELERAIEDFNQTNGRFLLLPVPSEVPHSYLIHPLRDPSRAEVRAGKLEVGSSKLEEKERKKEVQENHAIPVPELEGVAKSDAVSPARLRSDTGFSQGGAVRRNRATEKSRRLDPRQYRRGEWPVSQEGIRPVPLHGPRLGLRADGSRPSIKESEIPFPFNGRGTLDAFRGSDRNVKRSHQIPRVNPPFELPTSNIELSSRRAEVRGGKKISGESAARAAVPTGREEAGRRQRRASMSLLSNPTRDSDQSRDRTSLFLQDQDKKKTHKPYHNSGQEINQTLGIKDKRSQIDRDKRQEGLIDVFASLRSQLKHSEKHKLKLSESQEDIFGTEKGRAEVRAAEELRITKEWNSSTPLVWNRRNSKNRSLIIDGDDLKDNGLLITATYAGNRSRRYLILESPSGLYRHGALLANPLVYEWPLGDLTAPSEKARSFEDKEVRGIQTREWAAFKLEYEWHPWEDVDAVNILKFRIVPGFSRDEKLKSLEFRLVPKKILETAFPKNQRTSISIYTTAFSREAVSQMGLPPKVPAARAEVRRSSFLSPVDVFPLVDVRHDQRFSRDIEKNPVLSNAVSVGGRREVGQGFGENERAPRSDEVIQFLLNPALDLGRQFLKVADGKGREFNLSDHAGGQLRLSFSLIRRKGTRPSLSASRMLLFNLATRLGLRGKRDSKASISQPKGFWWTYSSVVAAFSNFSSKAQTRSQKDWTSKTRSWGEFLESTTTAALNFLGKARPFLFNTLGIGTNFSRASSFTFSLREMGIKDFERILPPFLIRKSNTQSRKWSSNGERAGRPDFRFFPRSEVRADLNEAIDKVIVQAEEAALGREHGREEILSLLRKALEFSREGKLKEAIAKIEEAHQLYPSDFLNLPSVNRARRALADLKTQVNKLRRAEVRMGISGRGPAVYDRANPDIPLKHPQGLITSLRDKGLSASSPKKPPFLLIDPDGQGRHHNVEPEAPEQQTQAKLVTGKTSQDPGNQEPISGIYKNLGQVFPLLGSQSHERPEYHPSKLEVKPDTSHRAEVRTHISGDAGFENLRVGYRTELQKRTVLILDAISHSKLPEYFTKKQLASVLKANGIKAFVDGVIRRLMKYELLDLIWLSPSSTEYFLTQKGKEVSLRSQINLPPRQLSSIDKRRLTALLKYLSSRSIPTAEVTTQQLVRDNSLGRIDIFSALAASTKQVVIGKLILAGRARGYFTRSSRGRKIYYRLTPETIFRFSSSEEPSRRAEVRNQNEALVQKMKKVLEAAGVREKLSQNQIGWLQGYVKQYEEAPEKGFNSLQIGFIEAILSFYQSRAEVRTEKEKVWERLEASIGVIELVSFRIGFAVVPGLAPFLPLIKLNLFGIVGSEGASLGANLSRAQRLELLNYQDQLRDPRIKSPASPSETPRAVVLVSDGRNVPQVDLEAMELPLGSRVVVMAPARSKLHAYERYAKVRVPGVTVRLEESAGEFPSLEQLQKIFSERLDSIPILVFPPGFIQLESFRGAAAREGFVFSMPWHPSDRLAMLKLVSDNLPRNLLGKFDEEILTMRFYSDTLSPISIPFNSRGGVLAEAYLSSLTRQRQLETAA